MLNNCSNYNIYPSFNENGFDDLIINILFIACFTMVNRPSYLDNYFSVLNIKFVLKMTTEPLLSGSVGSAASLTPKRLLDSQSGHIPLFCV